MPFPSSLCLKAYRFEMTRGHVIMRVWIMINPRQSLEWRSCWEHAGSSRTCRALRLCHNAVQTLRIRSGSRRTPGAAYCQTARLMQVTGLLARCASFPTLRSDPAAPRRRLGQALLGFCVRNTWVTQEEKGQPCKLKIAYNKQNKAKGKEA
jgi:hypothetical protein